MRGTPVDGAEKGMKWCDGAKTAVGAHEVSGKGGDFLVEDECVVDGGAFGRWAGWAEGCDAGGMAARWWKV